MLIGSGKVIFAKSTIFLVSQKFVLVVGFLKNVELHLLNRIGN